MTSTNDGKDVKSDQTSGPKGKTYYIELYKSLESRLSGEGPLRTRTAHLGEAWRRVHSLCQHSAPSTHPHLLSWLQRHTAKTVLQTEWQSPTSKDEHTTLEEAINTFIKESQTAIAARNGVSPAWESQLLQRAEWFKRILSNPWGHPVLRVLLDPRGKPPSDDEILEWLKEERGVMFVTRLRQLAASKCDDLAMLLTTAVMGRVRAETPQVIDMDQCEEPKDKPPPESCEPTFANILKNEAGFTVDVWELLTDIEFVLLYKRDRHSSCIDLAKQTPLRNGYQLVERLQSRLETSPREKKLWRNAKEVAALITQVIIARCMVVPVCSSVCRSALYCCTRSLVRLVAGPALPAAAAALAAPAATARHLHTLATAVNAQSTDDMKPFVCELYVRAITAGMNELERLKINAEKESEARQAEQTLSAWFTQLGGLLAASDRIKCECTLTAFSVHPSPAMYERIKAAPLLPPVAIDKLEPKDEATNSEYGSWASDSRSQTNFVKTSETLNLKQSQFQANVLSTAILTEGERLGLCAEVCQDIAVLLSGPRVKTLSWDMDRELLLENCRTYIERTHGGTRALTTELKYLNLDPAHFQHLPEEDDGDTDIYYGIEKGYEHLVEFQEPEEIWQDAVIDPEQTDTACSSSMESVNYVNVRRKKKVKKVFVTSEEESDPLSLVAEAKRAEEKKERPHSKERSKERKQNKLQEKTDQSKKEQSCERRKQTHKKDNKKEKKERKKRKKKDKKNEDDPMVESLKMPKIGSLSSLIGMKVADVKLAGRNVLEDATKASLSLTGINYDSQGKILLNSYNSEGNDCNVLFDGLYSMDELKSPEKSLHAPNQINKDKSVEAEINRVPAITDSLSYVTNMTTVSEEVKLSISKLIHFRRQRQALESAIKESVTSPSHTQTHQHNGDWSFMAKQTYKSPKAIIKQEIPLQSQISPKVVTIPEIPKMYIDKKQVEQLNELKNEVNDLLLNNTSKVSKNKKPPVATVCTSISNTNNKVHSTTMINPEKNKDITMHPNICQKQQNPVTTFTEVREKGDASNPGIVSNATEMLSKFDSPSQKRFQDFLKELQESINAGAGVDKAKMSAPQATSTRKDMKPMSRVTPVMLNAKNETKFSLQSAKPLVQQKKVETSLNTFSRLSYMHKNKLTDSKIKQETNTDHRDPIQQRIGYTEMDRIFADHKHAKMKYLQCKNNLVISRVGSPKAADKTLVSIKKGLKQQESPVCKEHPVLSDLLLNQIKHVQSERPNFLPPSVPLRSSSLLEKDQEDLRLLLRQQGKLNSLRNPSKTDKSNKTVPNVQFLQSSTKQNMSSTTSTLTTKIPTSDKIIATPQVQKQVELDNTVQIPTVTKPTKSTNILQNDDVKPKQQQPIDIPKPIFYFNEASDLKNYSSQPKQDSVIDKTYKEQPSTNEDKQTDWESVMNAILAQKTPSRGPNALEMALNKDTYKGSFSDNNLRNQRIVRTKSTGEINLKDKVTDDIKYYDKDLLKSKNKLALGTSISNLNVLDGMIHNDKGLLKSKVKLNRDISGTNLNVSNDLKHKDKGFLKSKTKLPNDTFDSSLDVSNDIKHQDNGLLKSKTKSDFDTSCNILNVSNDIKSNDKSLVKSKTKLARDTSCNNLNLPNISQRETDKKPMTRKYKPREKIKVTKQPNKHILASSSTPILTIPINLETSKKTLKKSSQIDGKLISGITNNQHTSDNRKRQFTCPLPKEDDPFISGIQNSDYDLLEELMDDDLRQEIGELSSDEETYVRSLDTQKSVKTDVVGKTGSSVMNKSYNIALIEDKIRSLESTPNAQQKSHVMVEKSIVPTPSTKNRYSKNIVTEAALKTKAHSVNNIELRPKDVINPDKLISKPCMGPPKVIRNLPSNIVLTPKNDTKQYFNATINNMANTCNSQVKDPNNVFMTAVPQQTSLQNVVIIGSELIYDPFTSIQAPLQPAINSMAQNTYVAFNNAPNMTLLHTTQFSPTVNPLIIGNAITMPVVANFSSTIVTASPIINNTVQPIQTQPTHILEDTLRSEQKNSNLDIKPTIEPYLDDNYHKMENKTPLDVNCNKNIERKVLSQVQENQNLTPENNDTKNHKLSIENDTKNQTLKDQERLKKKRMAIINREICHRCDIKPIPLGYEPLMPQVACAVDQSFSKQMSDIVIQDINKTDLKLDVTTNQNDSQNGVINSSANLDGNENCKENESTSIPCRRILLRSSNKLKPKTNLSPEDSKNHVGRKTKVRLKVDISEKNDIPAKTTSESEDTNVVTSKRTSKRTLTMKLPKLKDIEKKIAKTRCKRIKGPSKIKELSKIGKECKMPKIESSEVKLIDIEDELLGSKIPKTTTQTRLTENGIEAKVCGTMSKIDDEKELPETKTASNTILTNCSEAKVTGTISKKDDQHKVLNDENNVLDTKITHKVPVKMLVHDAKPDATYDIKSTINDFPNKEISDSTKARIVDDCPYGSFEPRNPEENTTQHKEITENDKSGKEIGVNGILSKKTEAGQCLSDDDKNSCSKTQSNDLNRVSNDITVLNYMDQDNTVMLNKQLKILNDNCLDSCEKNNYKSSEIVIGNDSAKNIISTSDRTSGTSNVLVNNKINCSNENEKKSMIFKSRPDKSTSFKNQQALPVSNNTTNNKIKVVNASNNVNGSKESVDNIPQSLKDSIIIEHLPNDDTMDSIKKCVRIKLPSGRAFKATVHGSMPVNFDSLFADPAIKSVLLNTLSYKKKYTLNIKQVTTSDKLNPHKILETRFQDLNVRPKFSSNEIETVNLLSDDDDEDLYQNFKTEFGSYKIPSMDKDVFMRHQNKFNEKCCVKLMREMLTQSMVYKENAVVSSIVNTEDSNLDLIPISSMESALPENDSTGNNNNILPCKIDNEVNNTENTIIAENVLKEITSDDVNFQNNIQIPDVIEIDDSSNDTVNLTSYASQPKDLFPEDVAPEREETINQLKDLLLKELGVEEAIETYNNNSNTLLTNESETIEQCPIYPEDISKCVVEITKCDNLIKKYDYLKIMNRKCIVELIRCDDLIPNTSKSSLRKIESDKEDNNEANHEAVENYDEENIGIDIQDMFTSPYVKTLSRSGSYSILDDFSLFDDVNANVETQNESDRSSPVMEVFQIIAALENKSTNASNIREQNIKLLTTTEIHMSCDSEWLMSKRSLNQNHKSIINEAMNSQHTIMNDEVDDTLLLKEVDSITDITDQNIILPTSNKFNISCVSEYLISKRTLSKKYKIKETMLTENKFRSDADNLLSKEASNIVKSDMIEQRLRESTSPDFRMPCDSEWLLSKRSVNQNLKTIIKETTSTQNKIMIVGENTLSKEVSHISKSNMMDKNVRLSRIPEIKLSCDSEWIASKRSVSQYNKIKIKETTITQDRMILDGEMSNITGSNTIAQNLRLFTNPELYLSCESEWLISKRKISKHHKTILNETMFTLNKIITNEDNIFSKEVSNISEPNIKDKNITLSTRAEFSVPCESEWRISKCKQSQIYKSALNETTQNKIMTNDDNVLTKDLTTLSNHNSKDKLIADELRPLKLCVPTLLTTVSKFLHVNPTLISILKPSYKRKTTLDCVTVACKIPKFNINTYKNKKRHKIIPAKESCIKSFDVTNDKADTNINMYKIPEAKERKRKYFDSTHKNIRLEPVLYMNAKNHNNCETEDHKFANSNLNIRSAIINDTKQHFQYINASDTIDLLNIDEQKNRYEITMKLINGNILKGDVTDTSHESDKFADFDLRNKKNNNRENYDSAKEEAGNGNKTLDINVGASYSNVVSEDESSRPVKNLRNEGYGKEFVLDHLNHGFENKTDNSTDGNNVTTQNKKPYAFSIEVTVTSGDDIEDIDESKQNDVILDQTDHSLEILENKCPKHLDHKNMFNSACQNKNINNTLNKDLITEVPTKIGKEDSCEVINESIINPHRTDDAYNIDLPIKYSNDKGCIDYFENDNIVVILDCQSQAEYKDRKREEENVKNTESSGETKQDSPKTINKSDCNRSNLKFDDEHSNATEASKCNNVCTDDNIIYTNDVRSNLDIEQLITNDDCSMGVKVILAKKTEGNNLYDEEGEKSFAALSKGKNNESNIKYVDENLNANEKSDQNNRCSLENITATNDFDVTSDIKEPLTNSDYTSMDVNGIVSKDPGIHPDSNETKCLEVVKKSKITQKNTKCTADNITNILNCQDKEITLISQDIYGIDLKGFLSQDEENKNFHDVPKNKKELRGTEITVNCDHPNMQFVDKRRNEDEESDETYILCTENSILQSIPDIKLLPADKDDISLVLKDILGVNAGSLCQRQKNRKDLVEIEKRSCKTQNKLDRYLDLNIGDGNLEIANESNILTKNNISYMNILESTSENKQVTLMYKNDSGIILKGIEYEDPEVGTCYMFPIIQSTFDTGENYDIITDESTENIPEIDHGNIIEDEANFKVIVPNVTYSRKSLDSPILLKGSKKFGRNIANKLKRKIDIKDVRIAEKRYRKGKNIDHPKSSTATFNSTMYCKEYKRLLEYCSSLKFSYSRPFHKEHIDIPDILTAWPINGPCAVETKENVEIDRNLFNDIELIEEHKVMQDPMQQTLAEELVVEYKEPFLSSDINETNFSMGFGEGSGRVIQNLEDGGDISKFSAATLSDVKQSQPFLLSKDCNNVCINEQKIDNTKKDQMESMNRYSNYLYLKDKVRSFFKKSTFVLNNNWIKDQRKNFKDYSMHDITKFPFGLNLPDFIEPAPIEAIVQVVQVGQLPVSAAAQNPVTCDPRVTQVSDASPSQCSAENSSHDDSQSAIQNEYTELTTADLRLPMQEYVQHNQIIHRETHESMSLPTNNENIPIETEIKSIVKIELMEDVPDDKEDLSESFELNHQQPLTNNQIVNNIIDYSYDTNNTNTSTESESNMQLMFSSTEKQSLPESFPQQKQQNGCSEKTDQIAHAMNAAGITTSAESLSNARAQALVNMLSQKIRQGATGTTEASSNNYSKATSINAMALQQALAQILPPPLNQTNSENNQQTTSNPVTPQVLHIVQGTNASGNQITLVDNTQQSVISTPNSTPVLHIVQNKSISSGPTSNGTAAPQSNSFGGLSLVDTGLQQGGNQLLHIVNTGNQKNNAAGQLLKRVNLLTNLTNVQGSNDQKMVQFVCKSADGKAIQLNAPHQRSMVLRLQPIESPNVQTNKSIDSQDLSPSSNSVPSKETLASQQEIKSRSVYEENYAKFIQNSSTKTSVPEKSTSLPKFNQAFGKQVFQDGNQKQNEMNNGNSHLPSVNTNPEHTECQTAENSINLEHISQISNPPLLLRKSPAQTSQPQPNIVQQMKQTIAPMNIQTMHGGVIYTRQIPVNIGGGQTINLITVPSTELMDDPSQKQQSEVKFVNQNEMEPSIIKIVPQSQTASNAEISTEENNSQINSDNAHNAQTQPVLTQMRIKLPMLSKNPQMVSGTRVVRPSFFQIQRNVIGGANQPVYQQLVLTAAPPLGQQTLRLPQTQTNRHIKVPSESQSSSESQMSSSTLEQLREFDLVLEQVKERSTVQPNATANSPFSKLHKSSSDSTDGSTSVISGPSETTQVLYSIGNNQPINVTYVNRKATVTTPTTSTYVRSPDSSGIADSPTSSTQLQIPRTVTTESSSSEPPTQPKAARVGSRTKSRPKASSNPPNTFKISTVPPKMSIQKPQEDEQTTQRILYILAEYKEQVENSPDKNKPAPRRRSNPPSNPGSSKRKKCSGSSRRSGRDMSPIYGDDSCRTMGSEDSSCGTSQGDCNECCLDSHSPQDSPRKFARKLTFEQETPIVQPRPQPQRNVIVADGQTITVARGTAGKPTTAVLMPANYLLPVSMVKGGQQIAIVTNRGPKLLTVGGEGGATNALLLQRLIGPAGLKPVLTRPGVRHVRLPTAALQNFQAFNLATATTVQPPDSTAAHASSSAPPLLIDTKATRSPWTHRDGMKPERSSSPDGSEPWNLTSTDPNEYTYEETVRTDNMNRTVLVVHKKDGSSHRQHRLTHVSAAALRHKYAILEHELRLQKSLSEECEDLGVDSPSASELFPEAELLFAGSPAHDHTQEQGHHSHTPQPTLISGSCIPQPDLDDQIATDQLLTREHIPDDRQDLNLGLEDVGIVTVSEDGMQATIALDHEEFARSHPNTTFHSEPTDVGAVHPFTIAGLKTRHITSIFHANRAPGTVLMTAPQTTVISQATAEPTHTQNHVKYTDIDNMIDSLPAHSSNINLSSVLVKDDGLTRFDSILTDSRELHLSNTASAIIHSSGNATQVIRRVCYDDDKRERDSRFLMDEPEGLIAGNDAKMIAEDSSRDATLGSMTGDVDDDRSSPERHAELFWESNSASERSEGRRPLDFSSDSDKCCKSPSFDETNSTDSSGVGTHMRLDSVIKEARGINRSASGSSADDTHPPLRTYPPKRLYQPVEGEMERSVSGKTRAGERSPHGLEVRRRASGRGVVKRGCHCCNGSPAPPRPKKSRQRKPTLDFTANN